MHNFLSRSILVSLFLRVATLPLIIHPFPVLIQIFLQYLISSISPLFHPGQLSSRIILNSASPNDLTFVLIASSSCLSPGMGYSYSVAVFAFIQIQYWVVFVLEYFLFDIKIFSFICEYLGKISVFSRIICRIIFNPSSEMIVAVPSKLQFSYKSSWRHSDTEQRLYHIRLTADLPTRKRYFQRKVIMNTFTNTHDVFVFLFELSVFVFV